MEKIVTKNVAETQEFAKEFARRIQPGDIITLSGDLGAGKTAFTQGFAQGLGITHRIISPTFIIVRSYELKTKKSIKSTLQNFKTFYHIDLYRINKEKDLDGLGLQEIFSDREAVVVIEWPERLGSLLPKKRWDINIETISENERKITLKNF